MQAANYVLKTRELFLQPNESVVVKYIRQFSPLIGVLFFAWYWFNNGFSVLSVLLFIILMIAFLFWSLFGGKTIRSSDPVEFHFYDDHLVFFRPIRRYSYSASRQEKYTINYSAISELTYQKKDKHIRILGDIHFIWHKLDANNQLIEPPQRDEFLTEFGCFSWLADDVDIDFVSIVERYTPIKVTVHDW